MRGKLLWVLSSAAVLLSLATPVRSEYLACHFYTGVVADSDRFIFYAYHHAHHQDGHYRKMVERLFEQMAPLHRRVRPLRRARLHLVAGDRWIIHLPAPVRNGPCR